MKLPTNSVAREIVDRHRRVHLQDVPAAHDGDAVAETERFDLVVRHVDGRGLNILDQLFQFGAELESQQRVQIG